MYKLNILPVALFEKQISKNNMLFSHEKCDVCGTQGIKFEAVSYKGAFDYNRLRYHTFTHKNYNALGEETKKWANWLSSEFSYIIHYVCSQECATMLQFQLGE